MEALEVLPTKVNFEQDDVAEVRLGMVRLPSDRIVFVSFNSTIHQKTFLVSLPTAVSFRAKLGNLPVPQAFEIARLDGATINRRGQVRLCDGVQIRAVEIIPTLLPCNITRMRCLSGDLRKLPLSMRKAILSVFWHASDYHCSHHITASADPWPDHIRPSDLELRFICTACGKRGADIRPDFHWDKQGAIGAPMLVFRPR